MNRVALSLYAGEAIPNDVLLRDCSLPVADPVIPQVTDIWMYQPTTAAGGGTFPIADDVRDGVDYGPTGADYDGDLILPAVGDVREGVGYGADGTEYIGILVVSTGSIIFFLPYIFHGRPRFP